MALLARMVACPLAIEVRNGAVAALPGLLSDGRISAGGHVAVVVGPGLGEEIVAEVKPALENCVVHSVERRERGRGARARRRAPRGLPRRRRRDRRRPHARRGEVRGEPGRPADGLGGDEPRPRRHRLARRLARGRRGPQGLLRRPHPDRASSSTSTTCARSPEEQVRSGIGDALSNLSALADWELAAEDAASRSTGLRPRSRARAPSRCSAMRGRPRLGLLPARPSPRRSSSAASRWPSPGSSRPCSGAVPRDLACDRRALSRPRPATESRSRWARSSPPSCARTGSSSSLGRRPAPPRRRPRCPATWARRGGVQPQSSPMPLPRGPTGTRSSSASTSAEDEIRDRVAPLRRCRRSLSSAPRRSPTGCSLAREPSTGPGALYMRRLSPYLTRLVLRTPLTANGVTSLMIPSRAARRRSRSPSPGSGPRCSAVLLIQLQLLLDCSRRRGRPLAQAVLAGRRLPRPARALLDRGRHPGRARRSRRRRLGLDRRLDGLGLLALGPHPLPQVGDAPRVRTRSGDPEPAAHAAPAAPDAGGRAAPRPPAVDPALPGGRGLAPRARRRGRRPVADGLTGAGSSSSPSPVAAAVAVLGHLAGDPRVRPAQVNGHAGRATNLDAMNPQERPR